MLSQVEFGRSIINPVTFTTALLCRRIWAKQREIAESVGRNYLTSVKGCHASGKTFLASGLPLWWNIRHKRSVANVIAPTLRQVVTFWKEVHLARAGGLEGVRKMIPEPNQIGYQLAHDRYAAGATSSRGVNIQGLHSDNLLLIIDEAPGVETDIFDAIEGIGAGGNVHRLMLGNPVVPAGEFFDSFHRAKELWNGISISAFDTPNLQHETTGLPLTIEDILTMSEERLDFAPFPMLIRRRWVKERYIAWGPTHPKYLSRVMADFPTQADNAVFALQWIEAAKREPTEEELQAALNASIQVGIDVAGAGSDETVLVARVNGIVLEMHAWSDADPFVKVVRVLSRLATHPLYRLGTVVVDIVGIGYNFALALARIRAFEDHMFGHVAGAAPHEPMLYSDQKAESAFQCREWFKLGLVSGIGTITNDNEQTLPEDETEAQLSTILYRETNGGKTQIIPKDEMLKLHNIGSPDRAEAVIMSFMKVIPRAQRHEMTEEVHISRY